MTWRSIWSVQVKGWRLRGHQFIHRQSKTLDSQQSVKAVDGGHSCRIWAPWSIIKSSYNLGHHLKSRSQRIRVWNSSEVLQSSKTLEKSNLVNCGFNQWFDGWNWFEGAHSCPYKPHISCQTSSWKKIKSIKNFPEIESGPVISTAKNGNFLFDFKFFTVDVWHVIWGLYGHEWDLSNQFPPSNHWLNAQLTIVDFARVLVDWTMFWWIPSPYHLRTWLQMMSQDVWTFDYWSWCPNSARMATIPCFDWSMTVFDLIADDCFNCKQQG